MKLSQFATSLALLLLLAPVAMAQPQADETATQATIDSLTQRIERLERRAARWEKVKKYLTLSGYLQVRYQWDDRNGSGTSTFFVRRARLAFSGDLYDGRYGVFDYKIQADFATSRSYAYPRLVDAFVRYRPKSWLGIEAGLFQFPFTLESPDYASTRLEFVQFSTVIKRMVHMSSADLSGINSSGRDIGVMLFGGILPQRDNHNLISYALAVVNGNGFNMRNNFISCRDNNKSKDIIARLNINPLKELTLSGSYWWGEGEFASLGDEFQGRSLHHTLLRRYSGGVAYDGKHCFARGEYVGGMTGRLASEGFYLSAGYYPIEKVCIAARFDYFDENKYDALFEHKYVFAVNYRPWKYVRLQVNYTRTEFAHSPLKGNNMINCMVTGMF